jgi:hypothetical protein
MVMRPSMILSVTAPVGLKPLPTALSEWALRVFSAFV